MYRPAAIRCPSGRSSSPSPPARALGEPWRTELQGEGETCAGLLTCEGRRYHGAGSFVQLGAFGRQPSAGEPTELFGKGRLDRLASVGEAPFGHKGVHLIQQFGIEREGDLVERTAAALGREVDADERTVTEPAPGPAPTMFLGLDGTATKTGRGPPRAGTAAPRTTSSTAPTDAASVRAGTGSAAPTRRTCSCSTPRRTTRRCSSGCRSRTAGGTRSRPC